MLTPRQMYTELAKIARMPGADGKPLLITSKINKPQLTELVNKLVGILEKLDGYRASHDFVDYYRANRPARVTNRARNIILDEGISRIWTQRYTTLLPVDERELLEPSDAVPQSARDAIAPPEGSIVEFNAADPLGPPVMRRPDDPPTAEEMRLTLEGIEERELRRRRRVLGHMEERPTPIFMPVPQSLEDIGDHTEPLDVDEYGNPPF